MGIFADYIAGTRSVAVTSPRSGLGRALTQELRGYRDNFDPDLTTAYTARNEVQSIAFNTNIDGGTYKLKINLYDGTTYTTADIAYTANAATIQTALDTASPSTVPNGAVAVSGGNIATANVVLTYSGVGLANKNHGLAELVDEALTDGGVGVATPVVTVTTVGNPARAALQILFTLGVLVGTVPVQGGTFAATAGDRTLGKFPSIDLIKALARDASIDDGDDGLYTDILTVLGIS